MKRLIGLAIVVLIAGGALAFYLKSSTKVAPPSANEDLIYTVSLCSSNGSYDAISRGADPNYKGVPMYIAIDNDFPTMVELLLEKGANPNNLIRPNVDSPITTTPVALAMRSGNYQIYQILLKGGAKLDDQAVMAAVQGGNDKILLDLLKRKMPVNKVAPSGSYPIHIATKAQRGDLIYLLLCANADLSVKDRMGRTALDLAQATKDAGTIKLLSKQRK